MTPITQTPDVFSYAYTIGLKPEYGAWTATIPDLPGCIAVGETPQEALTLIDDARKSWITASLMHNLPVPEPAT